LCVKCVKLIVQYFIFAFVLVWGDGGVHLRFEIKICNKHLAFG